MLGIQLTRWAAEASRDTPEEKELGGEERGEGKHHTSNYPQTRRGMHYAPGHDLTVEPCDVGHGLFPDCPLQGGREGGREGGRKRGREEEREGGATVEMMNSCSAVWDILYMYMYVSESGILHSLCVLP